MHIVSHNFRNIDEPFSSFVGVVIDEFDDECTDDSDDWLFFGWFIKPDEGHTGCNWLLLSNECNSDDDDDDDVADGNIVSTGVVSSSVSGSERVRWWKQLRWFDFVMCVDVIVPAIELTANCVDNLMRWWELSGFMLYDADDVNEAVVVIGNENALWCDTVKSFDAITEKLFAATVKTKKEREKYT